MPVKVTVHFLLGLHLYHLLILFLCSHCRHTADHFKSILVSEYYKPNEAQEVDHLLILQIHLKRESLLVELRVQDSYLLVVELDIVLDMDRHQVALSIFVLVNEAVDWEDFPIAQ